MNRRSDLLLAVRLPLHMLALAGATSLAVAAQPRPATDGALYRQEVAVCDHIQQDRAACIREAGAARQAARHGGLTTAPDHARNALARCSVHPPAERANCEARILGTGRTTIEGSVLGGGLLRETVTLVPPAALPGAPPPVMPVMPLPPLPPR